MTETQREQLASEIQHLADRFVSLGADYSEISDLLFEIAGKLDAAETTLDEIEIPCKESRFVL